MRSWKDDDNEGTRYMPYRDGRVIKASVDIKRRFSALKGPRFGTTDREVLESLLQIAEQVVISLRLDLDTPRGNPPACQSSGGS